MIKAKEYWNNRYINGLSSGLGSVGDLRDFKWESILNHVSLQNATIFDYGCGDLSFWKNHIHPSVHQYTGYDISESIVKRHNKTYENSKHINFINRTEYPYISLTMLHPYDMVFCFDVLFHILDEKTYLNILAELIQFSEEYIFIYTWRKNPLRRNFKFPPFSKYGYVINLPITKKTDNHYQKYRNFDDYIAFFKHRKFYLLKKYYNDKIDKYGCMYVFKKVE